MFNQSYNNNQMLSKNAMETTPDAQYFRQHGTDPYIRGVTTHMPQPMAGNVEEDVLYPLESSLVTPQFNSGTPQANFGYAKGGMVNKSHHQEQLSSLPSIAELIRQQGNNEDTILAHINPLEAMILKQLGGSGTINPKTGLPQFSFWTKPGKAIKASLGGAGGAIIGNMLLPGIGGIIGGALGQGAQHAARGKSFGQGALKGASVGAMLPTAASLAGMGANALGMTTAGNALSNYGTQNSILAALGMGGGAAMTPGTMGAANGAIGPQEYALSNLQNNVVTGTPAAAPQGFVDKLMNNSSNFLSKPSNLLALATAAGSFAGRPKEKSPEKKASEEKRYMKAMQLSAEERAAMEADMLANRQMERRIARNQYLPEERFVVNPLYRKSHSPEEYQKSGKWLSYYDNPNMTGNPLAMKKGGMVPQVEIKEIQFEYPCKEGFYLDGQTNGQDDKINALLSDGEYVIPADVVAHIGDGNSNAGAKKFDDFLKAVRKSKGGRINLPPKAKSLSSYIMR